VKKRLFSILFCVVMLCNSNYMCAQNYNTEEPWTYWWWMGSAVDSANIDLQLKQFQQSGLGGVHIIPIYGVKGYESKFIPFMSKEWLAFIQYTIRRADSLGLGVDLTLGTGWPYGGNTVSPADAAKKFMYEADAIKIIPTQQKVKRAAPGGEGLVTEYFDSTALANYLKPFTALSALKLRALYNDSYEVYEANSTSRFFDKFKSLRGYDIKPLMHHIASGNNSDSAIRLLSDYRETMSDLLIDSFTTLWANWSRKQGKVTRNQAHGSPANLIDLYAACDIPETESFGAAKFDIPLLRADKNYDSTRFGRPNPLAMKFATSAANLTGKKLVSAETGTWLANHFSVSLSQIKPQVDQLFTAGINHIFYHGITYSPAEAAWPGWLFYASTNFGPSSHFWKDLPELNRYITNCQRLLQNSTADADILLYFPVYDIWTDKNLLKGSSYPLQLLDIHHAEQWLAVDSFGITADMLTKQGFQFDYISDRLIEKLTVTKEGMFLCNGATYKTLIIPAVKQIPVKTLQLLDRLAAKGATIIFTVQPPEKTSGLQGYQKNEKLRESLITQWKTNDNIIFSANLQADLLKLAIAPEMFPRYGLSFIRKKIKDGHLYFVSNFSKDKQNCTVQLAVKNKSVTIYNPLTNQPGNALPSTAGKWPEIFLAIAPGESIFIIATDEITNQPAYHFTKTDPALSTRLNIHWQINFPGLKTLYTDTLVSWTELGDSTHQFFSGTATYTGTLRINEPIHKNGYLLSLGDIRETAEIIVNGKNLGKVWCIPYQVFLPAEILREENSIELRVHNLSANAIIKMDKEQKPWKNFYDINFVDITYQPFNAADWQPVASGILGNLKLSPVIQ
jgi:hypothetical protein